MQAATHRTPKLYKIQKSTERGDPIPIYIYIYILDPILMVPKHCGRGVRETV